MADLKTIDKQILENLFGMGGGYVLDFSDRTIGEFFDDELSVNFSDEKYNYASGSKANRMRGFWKKADNVLVGESILKLIEYIEHKIILDEFKKKDYPDKIITASKEITNKLLNKTATVQKDVTVRADIIDEQISIVLNKNVFSHVQGLLSNAHYFNAVEEAYKIVREKLKKITGKEKAHEAFKKENYSIIFGHQPENDAELDFFDGVKFLHMAIQFLRNEKAHTPAKEIDKNLAIHYIVLASLAYDLIDRN
ncbi:MAG: TIGR02391 family protein [Candidatus Nealsonbacteria bacterium]